MHYRHRIHTSSPHVVMCATTISKPLVGGVVSHVYTPACRKFVLRRLQADLAPTLPSAIVVFNPGTALHTPLAPTLTAFNFLRRMVCPACAACTNLSHAGLSFVVLPLCGIPSHSHRAITRIAVLPLFRELLVLECSSFLRRNPFWRSLILAADIS